MTKRTSEHSQPYFHDRFSLEPIVLRREAARGRTIIEKFEDEAATCAFVFVLMTPDDQVEVPGIGQSVHDFFEDPGIRELRREIHQHQKAQARPNVIFELGWAYGRLGRDRVCILFKRGTQMHSDLEGIERFEFDNSVEEVMLQIERELKAAGLA